MLSGFSWGSSGSVTPDNLVCSAPDVGWRGTQITRSVAA